MTFRSSDYPQSDAAEVVDRNQAISLARELAIIHQRDVLQIDPAHWDNLDQSLKALYTESARLALHWCSLDWRHAARNSAEDTADLCLQVGDHASDKLASRLINAYFYTLIGDTLTDAQRRRLFRD